MASLFIIGNGFDLAHGMATKYNNFRRYLADNHSSSHHGGLYVPETTTGHHGEELQPDDEVVELIMYLIDAVAPFDYKRNEVDWNNIETLLGAIDLTECFDTVEEQYDREGDRNYFWERDNAAIVCDHVSLAVPRISEFFSEWIQTIEVPLSPKSEFQKLLSLNDDLFLTFNYTRTLEQLYSCPSENICHIHGVVSEDDFYISEDLILGHCGNRNYDNDETVPYEMRPALQSIYEELRKDTAGQMLLHQGFFEKLKNTHIEKIYSYGFSFSEVDLPYISEICRRVDTQNTTWLFHSFDPPEKVEKYKDAVYRCGFRGKYHLFSA